jgi:hypothetical protein
VEVMKMKPVIQITSENNIEEQYLLERFPEAVWHHSGGLTRFYLPDGEEYRSEIKVAITEWEERTYR